jgi:hypothetical protein
MKKMMGFLMEHHLIIKTDYIMGIITLETTKQEIYVKQLSIDL